VTQVNWLSVISLTGSLVLAIAAYRGHRVGARKSVVMALVWSGIFLLATAVFTAVGG
jgi:hypothetical protein